ncbi:lymphocyte antigen 96 isoform X2 [Protopterus annectens]|uniref:lymphocyte antigen 96 isoform X2 n=1 Tax=Protopterus annectens TaxID=7888 RepID=UPI001CFB2851|nr:lymphocyte antigen 96 isoform X2 [Protopterus annectens]
MQKHICIFLLMLVYTQTQEQHLLCSSPELDVWYSFCDEKIHQVSVEFTPCRLSNQAHHNITLSWIPRYDLITVIAKIRYKLDGYTTREQSIILCDGTENSEYAFCGTLKGESVTCKLPVTSRLQEFDKGLLANVIVQLETGTEHELAICMDLKLHFKI